MFLFIFYKKKCAHDWIRTSTPLKAPAPQAGMSTNFTTWAMNGSKYSVFHLFVWSGVHYLALFYFEVREPLKRFFINLVMNRIIV